MATLSKYRTLSITAVIVLAVTWLLSLAALWNSLYNISEVKKEGWVVFFMILVLMSAFIIFYLAYINTDSTALEQVKKKAFESGKSEVLQEIEKRRRAENEQKNEETDFQSIVSNILSAVNSARSESGLCNKLLTALSKELGFVQGIVYVLNRKENNYYPAGEYALTDRKPQPFKEGESLPGQAAMNKSMTILYDIPEKYFVVSSGLGSSQPGYLVLVPVVHEKESIAVLELASFRKPDALTGKILDKVLSEVGPKINKFITA